MLILFLIGKARTTKDWRIIRGNLFRQKKKAPPHQTSVFTAYDHEKKGAEAKHHARDLARLAIETNDNDYSFSVSSSDASSTVEEAVASLKEDAVLSCSSLLAWPSSSMGFPCMLSEAPLLLS